MMPLTEVVASAAGGLTFVTILRISLSSRPGRLSWQVVGGLCALFLAFSAVAALREGATGFWPLHADFGLWGNQVWFDLLLAAGMAFVLAAPRASAVGMRPPLWAVLVVATGSIGLLAMVARLLWLERRA